MDGASRGLSEAMASAPSRRTGLPSFVPEDAFCVAEATCSPCAVHYGSDPAGWITGGRFDQHDAQQDHRRARIDTHSLLLRQLFQPERASSPLRRWMTCRGAGCGLGRRWPSCRCRCPAGSRTTMRWKKAGRGVSYQNHRADAPISVERRVLIIVQNLRCHSTGGSGSGARPSSRRAARLPSAAEASMHEQAGGC